MDYASVNMWAVLVGAVASFAIGSLWYGPLFGKAWQKEVGLSDESIKGSNMARTFGGSFVLMVVMAFGMAWVFQRFGMESIDWSKGLQYGLYTGVFFVATSMGVNLLYELKSMRLWLINAGYQVLLLGLIGLILGAWH